MVAVHGQGRAGIGHLNLNALHRPIGHITHGVAQDEGELGGKSREAYGIALLSGLAPVGDGSNGFTRQVLKRVRLLEDVELRWAIGYHSGLFDGVGHVASVVLDVPNQQRAAGRTIQLHVSNFIDGVEGVPDLRYTADSHAHGHGNQRVNRSQTSVHEGDFSVLGE